MCSGSYHCTVMQFRNIFTGVHDVTITLHCVLVWICATFEVLYNTNGEWYWFVQWYKISHSVKDQYSIQLGFALLNRTSIFRRMRNFVPLHDQPFTICIKWCPTCHYGHSPWRPDCGCRDRRWCVGGRQSWVPSWCRHLPSPWTGRTPSRGLYSPRSHRPWLPAFTHTHTQQEKIIIYEDSEYLIDLIVWVIIKWEVNFCREENTIYSFIN